MPRSKNQKHHHWDIDDPHDLLALARRQVQVFKAQHEMTQAQAVAWLIDVGYKQSGGIPLPKLRNRENTEQSGTDKRHAADAKPA